MTDPADWLALLRVPGMGPATYQRVLERFQDPSAVLDCSAAELIAAGLPPELVDLIRSPDRRGVEADLSWAEDPDRHILTLGHPRYPPRLMEIPTPPPVLFVLGDPDCLDTPQLAVVGSRNPTWGGLDNARTFAHELALAGLVVTSGLALGIDAAGHEAALQAGSATIAVAANGLDRVYPARHRKLAREIARQGALVSEFPIGTPPRAEHFPRRNRIISGLSLGVLVIEAGLRSGSLITARLGAEQGREVFAVPGSIHNPLAHGCHRLIRQGAKLVEGHGDVLEELLPALDLGPCTAPARKATLAFEPDGDYRRLLEAVGYDPVPIDTLIERSGLTAEAVSSMLLIMELRDMVSLNPNGTYCRTHSGR
jgi:DNA processing protein